MSVNPDQPPPSYAQARWDATFAQVTSGIYEATNPSPQFKDALAAFRDFLAKQEDATLTKDQLKILKSQSVYVLEMCARHKQAGGDLSGVLPVVTEIFEDVTKQLDLKGRWQNVIQDPGEVNQLESAITGAFEQLVAQLRKVIQGEDAESTMYHNQLERARAKDRQRIGELENVIRQLAPAQNLNEAVASSIEQSLKIIGDQTVGRERVNAKRTLTILAEMTGQTLPPSTILDKEFVTIGTHAFHQGPSYDIFKGEYFTGEEIVIKVLRHRVDQETARRTHERFARQAVNWSTLRHDSILPFYGVGVLRSQVSPSEFQLYMVSPYLKNQDIRRYLKQYNGTTHSDRLQMALDIAKGLKYMHGGPGLAEGQGLVHSALNIFNVLVKDSGRVVISGFGHTKPVIEGHLEHFTGDNSEYRYMGPEMLDEAVVTYGSDIWSWAMTSLEILTDEPSFGQKTKGTKIIQLIAAEKRPARADHPKIEEYELSDEIWQLFEDCWKTKPQDRPRAVEVAQRLRAIIREAGRSSKPNVKVPNPPPGQGRGPAETELGRREPAVQPGSPLPRPGRGLMETGSGRIPAMQLGSPPPRSVSHERGRAATPVPHPTLQNENVRLTEHAELPSPPFRTTRGRPLPAPVISRTMTAGGITQILCFHGCQDITSQIDLNSCSSGPIQSGGFGEIHEGYLDDGSKLAIKVPRIFVGDSKNGHNVLKSAAKEIFTWSKHKHANILTLLGLALFQGKIAIVSPWMDNGTALDYISKYPDVDRPQLCKDVASGLAYLHGEGTVHGDLKGRNILVSHDGVAKIADFGSTVLEQYSLLFTGENPMEPFSLRWAAPELFQAEGRVSLQADVYALGMTILEIMTGEQPFIYLTDKAVCGAITRGEVPQRPDAYIPEASVDGDKLWEVLRSCWAHTAELRPGVGAVKLALSSITQAGLKRGGKPAKPLPPQAPGKPAPWEQILLY